MIVLLVMIQVFYCTSTREYTCRGKLVFDSSRLQEGIFIYALIKLYTKANLDELKQSNAPTCDYNILRFGNYCL